MHVRPARFISRIKYGGEAAGGEREGGRAWVPHITHKQKDLQSQPGGSCPAHQQHPAPPTNVEMFQRCAGTWVLAAGCGGGRPEPLASPAMVNTNTNTRGTTNARLTTTVTRVPGQDQDQAEVSTWPTYSRCSDILRKNVEANAYNVYDIMHPFPLQKKKVYTQIPP